MLKREGINVIDMLFSFSLFLLFFNDFFHLITIVYLIAIVS